MTRAAYRRCGEIDNGEDGDVSEDWFRSSAWDDHVRADFEARLARARARNRPQYLRIKALALRDAGQIDTAKTLLLRALDLPDAYAFEVASTLEHLGDLAAQQGDQDLAERYYRRILNEQPSLSGTTGDVEISLAELLLDSRREPERSEALKLLNAWLARPGLKFDNQLFRWHLALIRMAEQTGDRETVRRAATTALELADRGPQLPRHKDIGLVHADVATLRRLRKLTR
jgi:tetratricopeptide (TPR) repeat protein